MQDNRINQPKRKLLPGDWSDIWKEHGRWVQTVLTARTGDPELADDLFQEMALSISRNSQSWPDPEKIAPWLYRVAIRRVQLFRRQQIQRKIRTNSVESVDDDSISANDLQPLEWILINEAREKLNESLDQTTPQDREILMLKHGMNWSYQQIASHLGISRDKVIYRVGRARDRLRSILLANNSIEVFDD